MRTVFRLSALIGIVVLVLGMAGCGGSTDNISAYKGKTAQQIYGQAQTNINKGNFQSASQDLVALDTLYPFGPYARLGQLDMIYSNYAGGEPEMAVVSADRYLRLYPRTKSADYALYMRGLSSFNMSGTWAQRKLNMDLSVRDLNNFKESYGAFARLVHWYPQSIYTPNAKLRMAYIRNLISRHEMELATYYYNRLSYVAAYNRASAVVAHYQGSPYVIPALAMQVQCDIKLGLIPEALKTYKVMQYNYPNAAETKATASKMKSYLS